MDRKKFTQDCNYQLFSWSITAFLFFSPFLSFLNLQKLIKVFHYCFFSPAFWCSCTKWKSIFNFSFAALQCSRKLCLIFWVWGWDSEGEISCPLLHGSDTPCDVECKYNLAFKGWVLASDFFIEVEFSTSGKIIGSRMLPLKDPAVFPIFALPALFFFCARQECHRVGTHVGCLHHPSLLVFTSATSRQ